MPALIALLAANSLVVTSAWWHSHFITPDDDWLRVAFRLILFALIITPLLAWWSRREKTLTVAPLTFVGLLFLGAVGLFLTQAYLLPALFPTHASYVPEARLSQAAFFFGSSLLIVIAGYLALALLWVASGQATLRLLRLGRSLETSPLSLRLVSAGAIGLLVWTTFLIILNWFGALTNTSLWMLIALVALMAWRDVWALFRQVVHYRIRVAWPGLAEAILLALFFFLGAIALGDTVRPAPIGYDDMSHYFNRIALMTDRLTLLPTTWPNVFETLATGIGIASGRDDQLLPLSLGVFGLLIGSLIVFLMGRHWFGPTAGPIGAVTALSIPMGAALAIAETKPDSLLFPVMALAWWLFLEYHEKRLQPLLFFGCLMLGLAVTIKLTALFFAPALLGIAFHALWQSKTTPRSFFRTAALAVGCFLLPLLPWMMHDLDIRGATLHPEPAPVTLSEAFDRELAPLDCSYTGTDEDFARFRLHGADFVLPRAWYLPWDMTMNLSVGSFATEIGYIFLALLPWLLVVRQEGGAVSRVSSLLALGSLVSLGVWVVLGEQVLWYALPVIIPLSLLVAALITTLKPIRPLLARLLMLFLILAIVSQTLVRMKQSAINASLRYGVGQATPTEYIDTSFPGYAQAVVLLNADPEARIYITGSRYIYGIEQNDDRALMDGHFDKFACLLANYGPAGTAKAFRELDIRYVLFSKDLVRIMKQNNRPTLSQKIRDFTDFSAQYLRPVWGSSSHLIFELAPPKRSNLTE